MRQKETHRSSGQAIIEFCVCLVAVIALVAVAYEMVFMLKAQTETMIDARAQAAELAIGDLAILPPSEYMKDWEEGKKDSIRYTADDEVVPVRDIAPFYYNIVDRSVADDAEWNILTDHANYLSDLHNSRINPTLFFGMVKGESSRSVDLISAFQKLIYTNEPQITIKSEVWATWTKGIY